VLQIMLTAVTMGVAMTYFSYIAPGNGRRAGFGVNGDQGDETTLRFTPPSRYRWDASPKESRSSDAGDTPGVGGLSGSGETPDTDGEVPGSDRPSDTGETPESGKGVEGLDAVKTPTANEADKSGRSHRSKRKKRRVKPTGESGGRMRTAPIRTARMVVLAVVLAAVTATATVACGSDSGPSSTAGGAGATTSGVSSSSPPADPAGGASQGAAASMPPPPPPGAQQIICPAGTVTVSNAGDLRSALASARPGTVIQIADGVYEGGFRLAASGTEAAPIWVCGSRNAVIDGEDDTDYLFHLEDASYVRLVGFSLRNGRKGVMADRMYFGVIANLSVGTTGDEAIHLRSHSTNNLVTGTVIRDTGNRREKFGEGVYVGSATSNWCNYSECGPTTATGIRSSATTSPTSPPRPSTSRRAQPAASSPGTSCPRPGSSEPTPG
jgi:hypothetical protein